MAKEWSRERRLELGQLQRLLQEAGDINSGNRCLERIASCIDMANALTRANLSHPRKSFMHFLFSVAAGEENPEGYGGGS